MEDNDIIQLEDLANVRSATKRIANRTLFVAGLAIPVSIATGFAIAYIVYGLERLVIGLVLAAVFALIATFQLIRWSRHYRNISSQLDALELRVKNGERIYGSQVTFQ